MINASQKYWRLTAERPHALPDIFDLRTHKKIVVGDDANNDICLETIAVPFQFSVLKMKGGKPIVSLTHEVAPTFRGSFTPLKEWKNRLYTGQDFSATGSCEWKIADTTFKLLQVDAVAIENIQEQMHPLEKKHWQQSMRYTLSGYALLFLVAFTISFIASYFNHSEEILTIQKVSVADIKKVTQKTHPAQTDIKIEKKAPEQLAQKLEKPAQAQAARQQSMAPGKAGAGKPKNIQNLGLLAIQTTPGSSRVSMSAAPSSIKSTAKAANVQLGLGSATAGLGIGNGDGEGVKVAQLGTLSGQGYEGGLGDQMQSARIPSMTLSRKEIEIRGALDPAVIRQIIEERLSEIRYCYENALLKQKSLTGKVAASWTIDADGSVQDISSSSEEIRPEILQPCIRMQIKNWKFPNPKGGGVVRVKYPFVFSPIGGPQ